MCVTAITHNTNCLDLQSRGQMIWPSFFFFNNCNFQKQSDAVLWLLSAGPPTSLHKLNYSSFYLTKKINFKKILDKKVEKKLGLGKSKKTKTDFLGIKYKN